ncbi:MAG: NAD-dependent epimerase/dehydratase family protein [Firmicutes bacterium]|nr:NAD-dependent epimerase/dehydratase family protein [Bacillota bacterium]
MILVTGASGHLGNVLVRELIAEGEKVRALVYPGEPLNSLQGMLIEVIVGDVLDRDLMNRAMQGVDTVFHLAGIIAIRPGMEELMKRVNVEGTRTVAEVALKNRIRRFIHVSSVHAFRRESPDVVIDESTPLALDGPLGSYDRTKAEGTKIVLDLVKQGLNAIVACPSGIIGLHDYTGSEMGRALISFASKKPDILVDGSYDFVDVRDVVRGLILARDKGVTGEIYILSGARASVENLCLMAQAATGTKSPKIIVPIRFAIFMIGLFQGLVSWLKIKSRYTVYSLQTLLESSAFSSLKARRELGYQARPLTEAIADFINWANPGAAKKKEINKLSRRKGAA